MGHRPARSPTGEARRFVSGVVWAQSGRIRSVWAQLPAHGAHPVEPLESFDPVKYRLPGGPTEWFLAHDETCPYWRTRRRRPGWRPVSATNRSCSACGSGGPGRVTTPDAGSPSAPSVPIMRSLAVVAALATGLVGCSAEPEATARDECVAYLENATQQALDVWLDSDETGEAHGEERVDKPGKTCGFWGEIRGDLTAKNRAACRNLS